MLSYEAVLARVPSLGELRATGGLYAFQVSQDCLP